MVIYDILGMKVREVQWRKYLHIEGTLDGEGLKPGAHGGNVGHGRHDGHWEHGGHVILGGHVRNGGHGEHWGHDGHR